MRVLVAALRPSLVAAGVALVTTVCVVLAGGALFTAVRGFFQPGLFSPCGAQALEHVGFSHCGLQGQSSQLMGLERSHSSCDL